MKKRRGRWSRNAKLAMQSAPDYFVWWYSVKSIGLCLAVAGVAYFVGKERGRRQAAGSW